MIKNKYIMAVATLSFLLIGCNSETSNYETKEESKEIVKNEFENLDQKVIERNVKNGLIPLTINQQEELFQNTKLLNPTVPTIGLLMYNDVLMTELTAPIDVFSKPSEDGEQLFNVITIAESYDFIVCEEGLKMFPDYTFDNAPDLDILIVPSTYNMSTQIKNQNLVNFIKMQNENTGYTVSNCAGATLIGESGIADGKKIVTWIGGGVDLQKKYPNLNVQDDGTISYVEDGKFLSSNGNLVTYISSLELLEKLTSKEHRKFVEGHLYLERLQNWGN